MRRIVRRYGKCFALEALAPTVDRISLWERACSRNASDLTTQVIRQTTPSALWRSQHPIPVMPDAGYFNQLLIQPLRLQALQIIKVKTPTGQSIQTWALASQLLSSAG